MESISPATLSLRFGRRLQKALDRMGYPVSAVDRSRMLGSVIECDASLTTALINGSLLPDWGLLVKLCDATQREPGYFLDSASDQFPTETRLVKALGAGQDIVISLPARDIAYGDGDDDWSYVKAQGDMGFGVTSGDYIVTYAPVDRDIRALPNRLFLVGEKNRFEIFNCGEIVKGCVSLLPHKQRRSVDIPHLLRVSDKTQSINKKAIDESGFYFFGIVVATVRPSDVMLAL